MFSRFTSHLLRRPKRTVLNQIMRLNLPTLRYYSLAPTENTLPLIPTPSAEKISSHIQQPQTIDSMVSTLTTLQRKCLTTFYTGAMSYGSISYEAHTTIAEAVNRIAMALNGVSTLAELKQIPGFIGPMSNSGEGGELTQRNNTDKQSLIRQVASARFGVNGSYLAEAAVIEIKINQGAKPGVGGELPGKKVGTAVAEARLVTPGVSLASPPPHHDIYSIEDLKQLIRDLRSANPYARIQVKLAASSGIGVIAAGVVKCGADSINIAGPGGTGAAPTTAKYEFVHPWEQALAEVHQTLITQGLRENVKLTVSGGLQTGLDSFKALLLGANSSEVGTSVVVSLGCIMAEICQNGTCPTGIATTDQTIIDPKFKGTPENVARALIQTAISLSDYLEKYGFTDPQQAVGRTDLLQEKNNSPLSGLDKLLFQPKNPFRSVQGVWKDPGSGNAEQGVIKGILEGQHYFNVMATTADIQSFGARIGFYTHKDLLFKDFYYKNPITIQFNGLAVGQSFGFVAPPNMTLIAPNTNDGTGKSLDGATLYVQNQTGNCTGFGATRGFIYAKKTGGRTATRNSGAHIVTEITGPDAAGFMTGGSLSILGHAKYYPGLQDTDSPALFKKNCIGPNFGSGFSGGVVFLPLELYVEMLNKNYLAPSALEIKPQSLTREDVAFLLEQLMGYRENIDSSLVNQLLLLDREVLGTCFIKLAPDAQKKSLLIPTPEPELTQTSTFELIPAGTTPNKPPATGVNGLNTHPKDACGTGVLVNRDGHATRDLVINALTMLGRFTHRGATGIDSETGDGCGITWYGLDAFFQAQFPHLHLEKDHYAIIHIALPQQTDERKIACDLLNDILHNIKLTPVGERKVPVNSDVLGYLGRSSEPFLQQWVVQRPIGLSTTDFEHLLICAHLRFEFLVHERRHAFAIRPHIISAGLTVIYKAMALEKKLKDYFIDFSDPLFTAHAAAAHSRFSTNTLPAFMNIQMFRNLGNNGENNALQQIVQSLTQDPQLKTWLGLETINLDGFSDSHILSIYIDLLRLKGYSPEEIVAFTMHPYDPSQGATAEFYNQFGMPFEGPNASIITIGNDTIIPVKDRNGFRPLRGYMNKNTFYCGSELGAVDMVDPEIFDLDPARPLIIDLKTGQVHLYEPDIEKVRFHEEQIKQLKPCQPNMASAEPLTFSEEELTLRKYQAGWHRELEERMMQPLFQDAKDPIVSMGDHRPPEILTEGAHFEFGAFFKGKFSQVTNPALDSKREKEYMSARTFVGAKPALARVGKEMATGFLLPSPIVNNYEMALLMHSDILKTETLSALFPIATREEGLKNAIHHLCQIAIESVQSGTTLLILSDLAMDDMHAPIPPMIIAAFVHDALLKAGLRRQVAIGLQAASILTPRDIAQVISVGGVDIVNPYLPFVPSNTMKNLNTFREQCDNYQKGCLDVILGFMARMGISTMSAYRGTKGFTGYGIDADLAAQLGIHSEFGGIGLKHIAAMAITQHTQPKIDGLGRLDPVSKNRSKIWETQNTLQQIQRANGKKGNEVEEKMDLLRRSSVRGQYFLKPSTIWNSKNPMTICILGGGAAGFYQAQSLLKSHLPVNIMLIEKKAVNRCGLVGDGVAPDHVGTKNQVKIFSKLLTNPRFTYFGGIEIDKDVSLADLKSTYPCLIDCRGASKEIKLGVSGEEHTVAAGHVYSAYNNAFNPLQTLENNLPFFQNSNNPEIGIIGNGNVAADIARIFLKKPADLKKSLISPNFLALLEHNAPDCIRIFARGLPHKTKISLNELKQLAQIPHLYLTADFNAEDIDPSILNETEKQRYDFFVEIQKNPRPTTYTKHLSFHFSARIQHFLKKDHEVEAIFHTGANNKEQRFLARTFITAIGNEPQPLQHVDNQQVYASGWSTGRGGNLTEAENSAKETTLLIQKQFEAGKFHHTKTPATEQAWQLKSTVNNQEQLNILAYFQAGFTIETIDEFQKARRYQPLVAEKPAPTVVETPAVKIHSLQPIDHTNAVLVYDPDGTLLTLGEEYANDTLLSVLDKKGLHLPCDCDGAGKCGTCHLEMDSSTDSFTSEQEKEILQVNAVNNPNKSILSCLHTVSDLYGKSFFSITTIKKVLQDDSNSQGNKLS